MSVWVVFLSHVDVAIVTSISHSEEISSRFHEYMNRIPTEDSYTLSFW